MRLSSKATVQVAARTASKASAVATVEVGIGMVVAPGRPRREGQRDYGSLSNTTSVCDGTTHRNNFQRSREAVRKRGDRAPAPRALTIGLASRVPRREGQRISENHSLASAPDWHFPGFFPKFGRILQCLNHHPIFQTGTAQLSKVTPSRPDSPSVRARV